jgi:hypothetical protein
MIGAQHFVFMAHLHVAIRDITVALLSLLVGFELYRRARTLGRLGSGMRRALEDEHKGKQ